MARPRGDGGFIQLPAGSKATSILGYRAWRHEAFGDSLAGPESYFAPRSSREGRLSSVRSRMMLPRGHSTLRGTHQSSARQGTRRIRAILLGNRVRVAAHQQIYIGRDEFEVGLQVAPRAKYPRSHTQVLQLAGPAGAHPVRSFPTQSLDRRRVLLPELDGPPEQISKRRRHAGVTSELMVGWKRPARPAVKVVQNLATERFHFSTEASICSPNESGAFDRSGWGS